MLELALKAAAVVALGVLLLTAFMYVTQRGSLYYPCTSRRPVARRIRERYDFADRF